MATNAELIALFGDDFESVLAGLSKLPPEARELLDQAMGKMLYDADVFSSRVNKAVQTQAAAGISTNVIKAGLLNDMQTGGLVFGEIKNSVKSSLVEGINQSGRAGQFQALDPESDTLFTWVTVAGHKICQDCAPRGGEQKTLKEWEQEGLPGSGWSVCRGHCHCILDPSGKISPRIEMENIKDGKIVKSTKVKTGGVIEFTNFKKGEQEIEKYYDSALSKAEKQSINYYAGNGYSTFNRARYLDEIPAENDMLIKNGFTKEFTNNKRINGQANINAFSEKNIVNPMSKAPNYKGVTYRGEKLTLDRYNDFNLKKGDILPVKSFWSTSADKKIATSFAKGEVGKVIYTITGKRGKILNGLSDFVSEAEVLFMPNSKFRIDKVVTNKKTGRIDVSLTEI